MLKRPLNTRFNAPLLAGVKCTTIRDTPWPVGVPVMLYNWTGKPYRSPQADVAAVIVKGFWAIRIRRSLDGSMTYECGKESGPPLHETEGFPSRADLDAWFRALIRPGWHADKFLMRFTLADTAPAIQPSSFSPHPSPEPRP